MAPVATGPEPDRDCPLCPRLAAFRATQRDRHPDWHNAPVPTFGADARLLVVGLAPGLQGANRTGRAFTGDWAGDLLYETLDGFGFSHGRYAEDPKDGLALVEAAITNAVRCVPPLNKPTGPEIATCRPFLVETMARQPRLAVIVALGRIAHDSAVRALGQRLAALPFSHAREHRIHDGLVLIDSYHCSRYNTNTGVLTAEMFRAVFARARALVDASALVPHQA